MLKLQFDENHILELEYVYNDLQLTAFVFNATKDAISIIYNKDPYKLQEALGPYGGLCIIRKIIKVEGTDKYKILVAYDNTFGTNEEGMKAIDKIYESCKCRALVSSINLC